MRMDNLVRFSWLDRFLIWIASADEQTLCLSPPADHTHVKATALLLLLSMLYQGSVFALVSHSLFAAPGEFRPELVAASDAVAFFVMMIDSICVVGSQWHLSGIEEIRRGGLDISGGRGARMRASVYLGVRLIFALSICILCGIFTGLVVFRADVDAVIERQDHEVNGHLLAPATGSVDAAIHRAAADADAQSKVVASLTAQVEALRQGEIDPFANDARVQQAQAELNQLLQEKTKADGDVQTAESFAAQELAGAAGAGHTGVAGSGPRRRAALEQVAGARSHVQQVDTEVAASRDRLDAIRKEVTTAGDTTKPASWKLAEFEAKLKVEADKLAAAKDQLRQLTAGREDAIRTAIEKAPDYVEPSRGFLARIVVLEQLAESDAKIGTVIALIDLSSFGLECTAVLSKIASFQPTTYSALIARDAYLRSLHIADEINREIEGTTRRFAAEAGQVNPRPADNFGGFDADRDDAGSDEDEEDEPEAPPAMPAKRPRGRPRKNPPPAGQ